MITHIMLLLAASTTIVATPENYKPYQTSQMVDDLNKKEITHPLLAYPIIPGTPTSEKERKTVQQLQEEIEHAWTSSSKNALLLQLGHAYLVDGKPDQAGDAYCQASRIIAQNLLAHHGICYTHQVDGESGKAISCYNQILKQNPDFKPAQYGRAMALLARGNFTAGWHALEPFLQEAGKNADELRTLLRDNKLAGKKVVLTPEGGFGDTYQWIRYGKELQRRGANVIAMVQKPLVASIQESACFSRVIPVGSEIPKDAITVSIMSLPAIFNADEHTIPSGAPYLHANPKLVKEWQEKLSSDKNIRIGLCWQASVQNDLGRLPMGRRGIPLDTVFKGTAQRSDVSLYSLQQFDGLDQLDTVSFKDRIKQFPKDFDRTNGAFQDTGAVIKNLDWVITVDTGLAHYAAALGAQVILVLPYLADFRWTEGRSDSTYYPTLRVVKQQQPDDWYTVEQDINHILSQETKK